ncbi:thioesterase family protein [Dyella tabacisoli]|uniref:Thioesterase n=1 Tax=Dyella tabacisoli TaxID=2282381 RepID=A0A369UNV2_9GAMM|nr:thioesterase family protein [Dyella tabacisoli]RDD82326.1 thioesterase [Dyella tabacisoli]
MKPQRLPYTFIVPQAWCDYNNHFSDGYYMVAFGHATDAFFEHVGLGHAYRKSSRDYSTYTVEAHVHYIKEARVGDTLQVHYHVLDVAPKRLRLRHQMYLGENLIATVDFIFLHVDVRIPKSAAFPPQILQQLQQLCAEDKAHTASL